MKRSGELCNGGGRRRERASGRRWKPRPALAAAVLCASVSGIGCRSVRAGCVSRSNAACCARGGCGGVPFASCQDLIVRVSGVTASLW